MTQKRTDPEQARRFEEAARELGCDEDPKAFEKAFAKVVPPKHRPQAPKKTPTKGG